MASITVDTGHVMTKLCEFVRARRVPAYTRISSAHLPDMAFDIIDALLNEFVRVTGMLSDDVRPTHHTHPPMGSRLKSKTASKKQAGGGGFADEDPREAPDSAEFERFRVGIKKNAAAYFPSDVKTRHACLRKFKTLKHVGEGEFGDVYSMSDDGVHKYAVKVVTVNPSSPLRRYDTVAKEIEIGKAMGEAGVGPKVHAVHWCEEGLDMVIMMVMDFATHGDLVKYQRQNVLTEENMADIRAQIGRMHALGVCHNDLHCGNVLVTSQPGGKPRFWVSDYGWATDGHTPTSASMRRDERMFDKLQREVTVDYIQSALMHLIICGDVKYDFGVQGAWGPGCVALEAAAGRPGREAPFVASGSGGRRPAKKPKAAERRNKRAGA